MNSLEVKLLKEKWISGSMIEGCSCNNWYLEINKNRGDAASYSLDMVIHTDSNHDYPFVIITCGLKTSFITSTQLENLTIYSIYSKHDLQYTSFWSLPSIFEENDRDMTRQFFEKFILPASKTEPIIQATETFSKILLESLIN